MLRLDGKVVFMSGAGSVGDDPDAKVWGNGKATAVLLARQGAKIYGTDVRLEAADVTRRIIEAEGGTCVTRAVDMTKAKEVEAAVMDCVTQFGRIDILVNNVGGSAPGDVVSMSEEVWDRQIAHNLKTAFLASKYVVPVMERQGKGAIVNLASVAGLRMTPDRAHVAYSTTKGALRLLAKSVALHCGKSGYRIRCNTIHPGIVDTPLIRGVVAGAPDPVAAQKLFDGIAPLGRVAKADEIAAMVAYLGSDEAAFVTGAEFIIDGGATAGLPGVA